MMVLRAVIGLFMLVGFSVAGWYSDPEMALHAAQKENKPVVFYFYSNHCPYCKQVEEFVLSQEDVQRVLEGFHVVSLNIASDEGSRWSRKLGVPGVPAFIVYDPKQDRKVGMLFGSRPKKDVLGFIQGVCKSQSIRC
ncbi:MAG: thioredoxin [Acidobacteria bacterium]|jgi:thiol:disulfide interchange protein|nr:MAG: thioredoxin [Acidobacteriota bacterium]